VKVCGGLALAAGGGAAWGGRAAAALGAPAAVDLRGVAAGRVRRVAGVGTAIRPAGRRAADFLTATVLATDLAADLAGVAALSGGAALRAAGFEGAADPAVVFTGAWALAWGPALRRPDALPGGTP
jgi:hypothetical protein